MFSCKGKPKPLNVSVDRRRMDAPANIFGQGNIIFIKIINFKILF